MIRRDQRSSDWAERDFAEGQCAVTACVVQNYLGGVIVRLRRHLAERQTVSHSCEPLPVRQQACVDPTMSCSDAVARGRGSLSGIRVVPAGGRPSTGVAMDPARRGHHLGSGTGQCLADAIGVAAVVEQLLDIPGFVGGKIAQPVSSGHQL
ncbi:YunG family protein [Nocardia wallacei]|uniref:YunG family protein n=1 Tax=Nocardia wallacei TaxID=480035 RepID=UPI003CC7F2B7